MLKKAMDARGSLIVLSAVGSQDRMSSNQICTMFNGQVDEQQEEAGDFHGSGVFPQQVSTGLSGIAIIGFYFSTARSCCVCTQLEMWYFALPELEACNLQHGTSMSLILGSEDEPWRPWLQWQRNLLTQKMRCRRSVEVNHDVKWMFLLGYLFSTLFLFWNYLTLLTSHARARCFPNAGDLNFRGVVMTEASPAPSRASPAPSAASRLTSGQSWFQKSCFAASLISPLACASVFVLAKAWWKMQCSDYTFTSFRVRLHQILSGYLRPGTGSRHSSHGSGGRCCGNLGTN